MKAVSFGHIAVIDCGASDKERASLKLSMLSDNGNLLSKYSGVASKDGFYTSSDFPAGIATNIVSSYDKPYNGSDKKYEDNILKEVVNKLRGNDKVLNGIITFAPCITKNNQTPIIGNLKIKGTNKSLTDVDYRVIPSLVQNVLASKGIKYSENIKLVATNDMIGTGVAIVKEMVKDPELSKDFKEGYYAAFIMVGGGMGTGQIEHHGNKVIVKSIECGHNHVYGTGGNLEQYGASAGSFVNIFMEEANKDKKIFTPEQIQIVTDVKNGKVPMQFPVITLNLPKEEKDLKPLMKSELFEVTEKLDKKGDKIAELRWKDLDEETFKRASAKAVNKLAEAIAMMAATKVNEGANSVVLTGPLADGIRMDMKHNPDLFDGKELSQIIDAKIKKQLDPVGDGVAEAYNFKLLTNVKVKDNTQGGDLILKGKFIGDDRGNWLSIPVSALKTPDA